MTQDRTLGDTQLGATMSAGELTEPQARSERSPEVPRRIGRFAVLRRLGAGGMGVVYAAFDEELDRRVAIKLLHARGDVRASQGHARLLREAQAMAKLSHPNIATVFEVGTWEGQVFMAMEFVSGQSVGDWLKAAPRSPSEVLAVFVQAGRGLAAAHRAGLVHRDFKPDNAVIGEDQRVRVLDFGLARAAGAQPEAPAEPTLPDPGRAIGGSSLSSPLTATGAVLGTPAYMAPEQYLGLATDARTDQFSFCVSLFEALHGRRPFTGESLGELAMNVVEGRVIYVPRDRNVSGRLQAALARGLQVDPALRWPEMDALLAELERDPARGRRLWFAGLATAGVVGLAGAVAAQALGAGDAVCSGAEARLAGVWDPARGEEVARAIAATGLPFAADTAARVTAALDAYAADFVAGHRDACEAVAVRREQSEATREARMLCLDDRRKQLGALVDVLAAADPTAVTAAVAAAGELPAISACADLTYVAASVKPPDDPAVAQRAQALGEQLTAVQANKTTGHYLRALALLEPRVPEIEALAYPPLTVEMLLLHGGLLVELGRAGEAAPIYERGYFMAREHGVDVAARHLALRLTRLHGEMLAKTEIGLMWSRHAAAEVARLGDPTWEPTYSIVMAGLWTRKGDFEAAEVASRRALEQLDQLPQSDMLERSQAHRTHGTVLIRLGRYAEATREIERALELRIAALGPEHPDVAEIESTLGSSLGREGKYAEGLVHLERALALHTASLGPDSTWVGQEHGEIGSILSAHLGRFEEGIVHLREALRLMELHQGPDHPDVAIAANGLGVALVKMGRLDEGRQAFQRALEINLRSDPEHPDVAFLLVNIGIIDKNQGRLAEAQQNYERALPLLVRRLGAEHPNIGRFQINLGVLRAAQGDRAGAEAAYREALRLLETALGPKHPEIGGVLGNLSEVVRERGRAREALEIATRALEIYGAAESDPGFEADAQWQLAQALLAVGQAARAREVARAALATYVAVGESRVKDRALVEAWLARHR